MITGTKFKHKMAPDIWNAIYNENDGIHSTHLRFENYLNTLDGHIEENNKLTLEQLKKEDKDVARSILNQPDVDDSMNYFSDMLYKSLIVSLYTFLDNKMAETVEICKNHGVARLTEKEIKKGKPALSDLEVNRLFITHGVLTEKLDVEEQVFSIIEKWKVVRKHIVHRQSSAPALGQEFLDENELEIEDYSVRFLSKEGVNAFNDYIYMYLNDLLSEIDTQLNLTGTFKV